MAVISGKNFKGQVCVLVDQNGLPVHAGSTVTDHRGESSQVLNAEAPHKPGAAGFVTVKNSQCQSRLYPTVFDLRWQVQDELVKTEAG